MTRNGIAHLRFVHGAVLPASVPPSGHGGGRVVETPARLARNLRPASSSLVDPTDDERALLCLDIDLPAE